jgi:hypothetical protein
MYHLNLRRIQSRGVPTGHIRHGVTCPCKGLSGQLAPRTVTPRTCTSSRLISQVNRFHLEHDDPLHRHARSRVPTISDILVPFHRVRRPPTLFKRGDSPCHHHPQFLLLPAAWAATPTTSSPASAIPSQASPSPLTSPKTSSSSPPQASGTPVSASSSTATPLLTSPTPGSNTSRPPWHTHR